MSQTTTTYGTSCNRCGQSVKWSHTDKADEEFSGLWNKLAHHIKNDKACLRVQKLAELFDEETDLLGAQKYFI